MPEFSNSLNPTAILLTLFGSLLNFIHDLLRFTYMYNVSFSNSYLPAFICEETPIYILTCVNFTG